MLPSHVYQTRTNDLKGFSREVCCHWWKNRDFSPKIVAIKMSEEDSEHPFQGFIFKCTRNTEFGEARENCSSLFSIHLLNKTAELTGILSKEHHFDFCSSSKPPRGCQASSFQTKLNFSLHCFHLILVK